MRSRRARPEDAAGVHRLITYYADRGLLLPRTEEEILAHIERFLVLTEKERQTEKLLGCVALEPYGGDLAEIRSLAVEPETRGRGLGTRLLRVALAAARRRKIARVFAVTHAPQFFTRQGFAPSTRWALPEKLERDCRTCPKADHCELVAVIATVCPERVVLPVLAAAKAASAP
jgi:amino-acid N-acetyltransferase